MEQKKTYVYLKKKIHGCNLNGANSSKTTDRVNVRTLEHFHSNLTLWLTNKSYDCEVALYVHKTTKQESTTKPFFNLQQSK